MDGDNAPSDMDDIEKALEGLRLNSGNAAQSQAESIQILANASKHDSVIRQRLAEPNVLTTLVEIVDSSMNDCLETTDLALRCIGNASIDNNDAREILAGIGFSWAKQCLQFNDTGDYNTALLTAKVLYNICCDYEPAQLGCFKEHIQHELIRLCSVDAVATSEDSSLVIELLFWLCSHRASEASGSDLLPEQELVDLVALPNKYLHTDNTDDLAMLLETCLLYLRDAKVQQYVIHQRLADKVLLLLQANESRIVQARADNREDDEKLLTPLCSSLIWCLSDMSALPEFSQTHNLDTEWIRSQLVEVLANPSRDGLNWQFIAACQIVGNLLWSMQEPDCFAYLVEHHTVHVLVLEAVATSEDTELLHAAAGFLIQLSRPTQARKMIGSSENTRTALEKLCRHETPQLKQDGTKLLRALGRECRENQERFADLASEVMVASTPAEVNMIEQST